MQRQVVGSSEIRSVAFEPGTEELEIEFADGDVCRYQMVPEEIYRELVQAESAAGYFSRVIRERFAYTRVGAAERAD